MLAGRRMAPEEGGEPCQWSMGKSCSFSEQRGPVGSLRQCPKLGPQNNVVVKLSGLRNIRVAVSWRTDPAPLSFCAQIEVVSFPKYENFWLDSAAFTLSV